MTKHRLMIGTWTPPGAIFTVEFDDEALTLKLVQRTEIPHDEPISWMTFDHARKTIYGASMKKWASYSVEPAEPGTPPVIKQTASHPMTHDRTSFSSALSALKITSNTLPLTAQASLATTNTRAIFLLAAQKPPYCVYGNPFYDHAGSGSVYSVNETGALASNIQNFELLPHSGIHGSVFDPAEEYLYSADLRANKIWTHRKSPSSGKLELVEAEGSAGSCLDAPDPGDHPRWVEISASGKYLFVLMEHSNRLAQYVIDERTHLPVFTGHTYPLLPPGLAEKTGKKYRSDVVFRSSSGRHLFASARSNHDDVTGYISAFRLSDVGDIESQLFIMPTPTSGGHSNAVAPCPWSDEWLALTDDQEGFVEVYRWHGEHLGRVAHLDLKEPGAAMNAIWYD
jgi:carboxy-cis,cis-muconate cyclase